MRAFCEGLTALNDAQAHGHPELTAVHPVARAHPTTGRRSLFVNEHFTRRIIQLRHEESESLLRFLTTWVRQPRFTVRYHWTPGAVAMWDNRCTQQYVTNDFEGLRVAQRFTVMGDRPQAACEPGFPPEIAPTSAASRHDADQLPPQCGTAQRNGPVRSGARRDGRSRGPIR